MRCFVDLWYPKHGHSEHFEHLRKPVAPMVWETWIFAVDKKGAWSVSACSQRIDILAHMPCYSLGSNYPRTVEISSPSLNAYNSKPGPRLLGTSCSSKTAI